MSWERVLAAVAAVGATVLLVANIQDRDWTMVILAVVVLLGMGWWALRADRR